MNIEIEWKVDEGCNYILLDIRVIGPSGMAFTLSYPLSWGDVARMHYDLKIARENKRREAEQRRAIAKQLTERIPTGDTPR